MAFALNRRGFSFGLGSGLATLPIAASAQDAPEKSTWEQIQKRGSFRLGAAAGEPFYFQDITVTAGGPDSWKGIGPGLARLIAAEMGVKLDIVVTNWGTAATGLQSGQFDVCFSLDATPKRALAVDFVPTPLMWYASSALVRDGVTVERWEDMNKPGFNVGVNLGGSLDYFATKLLSKATINRYQKTDDTIASFQSGRSDAILLVASITDALAEKTGRGKSIIPKPVQMTPSGTAIRIEPDQRWKSYLDACIRYYYFTGSIQKIYDEFLTFRGLDPSKFHPITPISPGI